MFIIDVRPPTVKKDYDLTKCRKAVAKAYRHAAKAWKGNCKDCGNPLTGHGSYLRITPWQFRNMKIWRVECDWCKKTHALIPCFIIPYGRFLASKFEIVVRPNASDNYTLENLAELVFAELSTVSRWRKRFKEMAAELALSLARHLVEISVGPIDWAESGTRDPPEQAVFGLAGLLRQVKYEDFAHCDLALINLIVPLTRLAK